jgi:shikimate kinase
MLHATYAIGADSMAHVILAGFMATGKTEVGRRLARLMGRTFVDTDGLVEATAGRSIAEIFAADGEERFRELEREAVARIVTMPDAVVAVGGGTLVDPQSRRRLLAAGPVVCLRATPEAILDRVGDAASRPLLAALSKEERLATIRALIEAREAAYRAATHDLDTTDLSIEEVVDRVRALVGEA